MRVLASLWKRLCKKPAKEAPPEGKVHKCSYCRGPVGKDWWQAHFPDNLTAVQHFICCSKECMDWCIYSSSRSVPVTRPRRHEAVMATREKYK